MAKGVYRRASSDQPLRLMSEVEAAWVGAAIETDGWVTISNEKYWAIGVGSTDLEIISALLRATGVGTVCKPLLSSTAYTNGKPFWRWTVWGIGLLPRLAERLSPYSQKVRKILDGRYVYPSAL